MKFLLAVLVPTLVGAVLGTIFMVVLVEIMAP